MASKNSSGSAAPMEFLTPPWMTASPVFCRVTRVNVPQRIYVSGLFGSNTDPNSGAEVREVFSILQRALDAAGSNLQHLAKGTYYVSDAAVSKTFNDVRPQFYDPARPPAASKAQVAGSGKPPRTLTLDMIAVPKQP
ncbi:MAG: RidA family protein [Planctomycetaceae bacterium]|nr:RidA family protein [Planctomycetaceae bacterium]